jgi:hypothetical protein
MADAVALVPGFLGFRRRGALRYFSPLFVDGLARALKARGRGALDIVPLATSPIGSLARRQHRLRATLRAHESKSPRRWHLIGHSTGGVDAAMLLASHGLVHHRGAPTAFTTGPVDSHDIGSVITLSAPHFGTGLANEVTLLHGLRLVLDVFGRWDGALLARYAFARAAMKSGVSIRALLFHDDLARDLVPANTSQLTRNARRNGVPLFSFATCTPPPSADPPDPLFRDLWRWTAEGDDPAHPGDPMPAQLRWITSGAQPAIDARSNDGVVNTRRQVAGTLAAVVVGDHADVLGRFKRDGDPGLLTSEATFGRAQFDAMLDRIAECIDCAIAQRPLPP